MPNSVQGLFANISTHHLLWVGHGPGRARLGMGLGAIGAFPRIPGSDSSDEYRDRLHHGTDATGHGGPGSPQVMMPVRSPACGWTQ